MNINVNSLIEEIKSIQHAYSGKNNDTSKIEMLFDLSTLYTLYNELANEKINPIWHFENTSEGIKYYEQINRKYYNDLNKMYKYHQLTAKNILKIFKDEFFLKVEERLTTSLNKNDAIDILYDFFNNYDVECYKVVKKMIDNNQVSVKFTLLDSNVEGGCYRVPILNKSYILCKIQNFTIPTISMLAHEFGHAIKNELDFSGNNNFKIKHISTNYSEVISIYFEKLFLDYALSKNLCYEDTLVTYNQFYAKIFKYFLSIRFLTHPMLNEMQLEPQMYIPKELINKIIFEISKEMLPIKDAAVNLAVRDKFLYGYSSLIALSFIEQYREDKELGKKNLINYISAINCEDSQKMLNIYGLNEENISTSKVLKKELNKYMNISKKN